MSCFSAFVIKSVLMKKKLIQQDIYLFIYLFTILLTTLPVGHTLQLRKFDEVTP